MGPPQYALPPLSPVVRNILIGACALFVLELVLNLVQPELVASLAWYPLGNGFMLFQPLTRYLVQGPQPLGFLLSLMVLYFFLPMVFDQFGKGKWVPILVFSWAGSVALGLLADITGFLASTGPAFGWSTLGTACVALFGLTRPKAVVNLFFVLPIKAGIFAWGTGLIALLYTLVSRDLNTIQHLGTWCGLMAWWFGFGPGSRRRKLKAKARKIEKDLKRFTVLDGGQEDSNRGDWVN
jgi:hypothetical protein